MDSIISSVDSEFWTWVQIHEGITTANLAEEARKVMTVEMAELALIQIEARRKTGNKLKNLLSLCPHFLFPSLLLTQQCSAPAVADFNASVMGTLYGRQIVDLTFGLGFDAFAFAYRGAYVVGVDISPQAVEAGNYNAKLLNLDVDVECSDAIKWLEKAKSEGYKCAIIYVDPARRRDNGSRVYGFECCQPDLSKVIELARGICDVLYVKGSPMLDPDDMMTRWKEIEQIWCVGLKGECKELLLKFNLKKEVQGISRKVTTVDIKNHDNLILLDEPWPRESSLPYLESIPKQDMWVCLPSAPVLKGKPYGAINHRWLDIKSVNKAHTLYISENKIEGFPGRCMRILTVYDSIRKASRELRGTAANVAVAGYPTGADVVRTKVGLLPIADTSRYLIGCTVSGKKLLLWCAEE